MAIRFLCVLALTVVTVHPCQGWTFTSQEFGYSLDVPKGWEAIPKSIIKEHVAARFPNEAIVVDAGFQPASIDSVLGFPRIVAVVLPNAKMGISRQLTDREISSLASELSGYSAQELQELLTCSPKSDPCVMRVSNALEGKETQDDEATTAAWAGRDSS